MTDANYRSCPTHCCPDHGCKYGMDGCPVENHEIDPVYPNNNGCETCEWVEEQLLDAVDTLESRGMVIVPRRALQDYMNGYHHNSRGNRCSDDGLPWPCDVYTTLKEALA